MAEDNRENLMNSERQASRIQLDNGIIGHKQSVFQLAADHFNDHTWLQKLVKTPSVYNFDINIPARDGDQITAEHLYETFKGIRRSQSDFGTALRQSGQNMGAIEFISTGSRFSDEELYVYHVTEMIGEVRGFFDSDIGSVGFGASSSEGFTWQPRIQQIQHFYENFAQHGSAR